MQAKLQPTTMAHPDLAPGPGVYKEEPAPVAGDPVSTAFPTNYCPVAACVLFVLCFALLCFALLFVRISSCAYSPGTVTRYRDEATRRSICGASRCRCLSITQLVPKTDAVVATWYAPFTERLQSTSWHSRNPSLATRRGSSPVRFQQIVLGVFPHKSCPRASSVHVNVPTGTYFITDAYSYTLSMWPACPVHNPRRDLSYPLTSSANLAPCSLSFCILPESIVRRI